MYRLRDNLSIQRLLTDPPSFPWIKFKWNLMYLVKAPWANCHCKVDLVQYQSFAQLILTEHKMLWVLQRSNDNLRLLNTTLALFNIRKYAMQWDRFRTRNSNLLLRIEYSATPLQFITFRALKYFPDNFRKLCTRGKWNTWIRELHRGHQTKKNLNKLLCDRSMALTVRMDMRLQKVPLERKLILLA